MWLKYDGLFCFVDKNKIAFIKSSTAGFWCYTAKNVQTLTCRSTCWQFVGFIRFYCSKIRCFISCIESSFNTPLYLIICNANIIKTFSRWFSKLGIVSFFIEYRKTVGLKDFITQLHTRRVILKKQYIILINSHKWSLSLPVCIRIVRETSEQSPFYFF